MGVIVQYFEENVVSARISFYQCAGLSFPKVKHVNEKKKLTLASWIGFKMLMADT